MDWILDDNAQELFGYSIVMNDGNIIIVMAQKHSNNLFHTYSDDHASNTTNKGSTSVGKATNREPGTYV